MTRLDAYELLLDELKRYDPMHSHLVVCTILTTLGYADRMDAVGEMMDLYSPEERTVH